MPYIDDYLAEVKTIATLIDRAAIERTIDILIDIREKKGRLFFLGVGGGAGNASHAVNDFRKIAGFEAYAPTDNVSELTARINDDGWETSFAAWLRGSNLSDKDGVFVLSVGGGNRGKNVSTNLVKALEYAHKIGARIVGIVGRDGGYTAQVADSCIIIPIVNSGAITPHTEAFQSVIWHLIVSDPLLRTSEMKWEATK
jgi:D-sedoheptulose 7-phosphate isomerase